MRVGWTYPTRRRASRYAGQLMAPSSTRQLFRRDARGTAAIEFAAATMLLLIGLLNAIDLSFYALKRMDVENAAEIGAQAAWKACADSSRLPATQNCSGLNDAITTAIQATSLGSSVSVASGSPSEGYY